MKVEQPIDSDLPLTKTESVEEERGEGEKGDEEKVDVPVSEVLVESSKKADDVEPLSDDDEGGGGGVWNISKIYSIAEIQSEKPITCQTEGCTNLACARWECKDQNEAWDTCQTCQETDYDGWPEDESIVSQVLNPKLEAVIEKFCGKSKKKRKSKSQAKRKKEESNNHSDKSTEKVKLKDEGARERGDNEEEGEVWVVNKIYSVDEIKSSNPKKCQTDKCKNVACAQWISKNDGNTWDNCLECQENDFDGWPDDESIVKKTLNDNLLLVMDENCKQKAAKSKSKSKSITPKNGENAAHLDDDSNASSALFPHQKKNKGNDAKAGKTITPSPVPPRTSIDPKHLKMHQQWIEAAQKLGGQDARIIVKKAEAKKLIYGMLFDEYRPMNITMIHKKLKAVVPPPVLKQCLDDMTFNSLIDGVDSDDDSDGRQKMKQKVKKETTSNNNGDDEMNYAGVLSTKAAKSANATLYFIDQSKLENNGKGLLPEIRNKLYADNQLATIEEEQLQKALKSNTAETDQLLKEPLNEETEKLLANEENEFSALKEQVEAGKKLVVNEDERKKIEKQVQQMTGVWKKRKRQCIDFLRTLEENTDGTISVKKCLAGDGQMYIESDEVVMKAALELAKKRHNNNQMSKPRKRLKVSKLSPKAEGQNKNTNGDAGMMGLPPSSSFVAVMLSDNSVEKEVVRIHYNHDANA